MRSRPTGLTARGNFPMLRSRIAASGMMVFVPAREWVSWRSSRIKLPARAEDEELPFAVASCSGVERVLKPALMRRRNWRNGTARCAPLPAGSIPSPRPASENPRPSGKRRFGRFLQGAQHDLIEPHIHLHALRGRLQFVRRHLAGEHLVEHHAERIDVRAMIHLRGFAWSARAPCSAACRARLA